MLIEGKLQQPLGIDTGASFLDASDKPGSYLNQNPENFFSSEVEPSAVGDQRSFEEEQFDAPKVPSKIQQVSKTRNSLFAIPKI